jgi:hypothetical protein
MVRWVIYVVVILIVLAIIYAIYRKIRRTVSNAWDKSAEVVFDQQERWKQREALKKQPDFIQKAYQQSEQIKKDSAELPEDWQAQLEPLNADMADILSISINDAKRADKVRTFYNTSLPAYASFVAKLKTDHLHLDAEEKQKAIDNLAVFKTDFDRYDNSIQQARRFDFDVLMDVIKVRLKNR